MKYYLLTFNENWADEFDVPALQCFNENDYEKWLAEPAGRKNDRYEEELKVYEAQKKAYLKWGDAYRNFHNGSKHSYEELAKWRNENPTPSYTTAEPVKAYSYLSANLGNSGDGFEEGYEWALLNSDFISNSNGHSTVDITVVSKEFYDIFKKAKLAYLSLCNIFDFKADKYIDDDYEDEG